LIIARRAAAMRRQDGPRSPSIERAYDAILLAVLECRLSRRVVVDALDSLRAPKVCICPPALWALVLRPRAYVGDRYGVGLPADGDGPGLTARSRPGPGEGMPAAMAAKLSRTTDDLGRSIGP
jgi:hypothetical protein